MSETDPENLNQSGLGHETINEQMAGIEGESDEYWKQMEEDARIAGERLRQEEDEWRANIPDLSFDLNDDIDLRNKMTQVAEYIYSGRKFQSGGRHYDPYKGDMLCGPITDEFLGYLQPKGVPARKVERIYQIKSPGGYYDNSFGHVYMQIDNGDDHILVDPTYLQWVDREQRKDLPPVLVLRYKTPDEFREKLGALPIDKRPMVQAFYLGFDAPETLESFKGSQYTVLSSERARIDD